MSQPTKAPRFRGRVCKTVSPTGDISWVSELRTPVAFTDLGQTSTAGEAIARAIQKAYAPAGVVTAVGEAVVQPQPLRQAA